MPRKLPQGWLVNVTQTTQVEPDSCISSASSYRPAIPSSLPAALEYHPSHPVILSAHLSGATVYLLRCTG
ncbi:hypothetical protein K438DRAFT_1823384 [Mycena galopus ATCC 62051]|nr:hypothetical protein K438DRAFT_1823384 [Mycena galopus ATCC 62051]